MAEARNAGYGAFITAVMISASLVATILCSCPPILVWNASKSSPVGLYEIAPRQLPLDGDYVLAWAPPAARRLAAARSYLPLEVPLVKPVAASRGDRICAKGTEIFINRRKAASRRATDPSGRTMPWWSGCRDLQSGQYLLLSSNAPEAFDGRYFGISRSSELLGRARLLWTR